MQYKDYYQTLGIGRDASADEVKKAYRKLARKFHPDVSSEADAETRFKEIGEAYEVLKDADKRAAYDQLGRHWKHGEDIDPSSMHDPDFTHFRDAGAFDDFFAELFGRAGTQQAGYSGRGEDLTANVALSLEDAYAGATRALTINVPARDEHGHIVQRARTLNVRIPAGISSGQQIRLAGQGSPGYGRGQPGDLYLNVTFAPHPRLSASARDIETTLPITPWEAALGATVAAPTLGGPVRLTIPAGARSGQRLRLKGRGLPGQPPGDEYVRLEIVAPPARSPEQRALYEKMAELMPFDPRAENAHTAPA